METPKCHLSQRFLPRFHAAQMWLSAMGALAGIESSRKPPLRFIDADAESPSGREILTERKATFFPYVHYYMIMYIVIYNYIYICTDTYIYIYKRPQNQHIHFCLLPSCPSRPSSTGSLAPNDASDYWITRSGLFRRSKWTDPRVNWSVSSHDFFGG